MIEIELQRDRLTTGERCEGHAHLRFDGGLEAQRVTATLRAFETFRKPFSTEPAQRQIRWEETVELGGAGSYAERELPFALEVPAEDELEVFPEPPAFLKRLRELDRARCDSAAALGAGSGRRAPLEEGRECVHGARGRARTGQAPRLLTARGLTGRPHGATSPGATLTGRPCRRGRNDAGLAQLDPRSREPGRAAPTSPAHRRPSLRANVRR